VQYKLKALLSWAVFGTGTHGFESEIVPNNKRLINTQLFA